MANVKKFFQGNFLKPEDVKSGDILTILGVGELAEIQGEKGKAKEVLNYEIEVNGQTKTFTPNMTNGNALIEAFGEDDEKWVGKKCKINIVKIKAWGKTRDSIEIEPIKDAAATAGAAPVVKAK